jgi:glycosyltransferase involved in cell wall biosynthesis
MHICFVSREYPPNPMGGIGTYVFNMTRVLAEAGNIVSVLTQDHPDAPSHGYDNPAISCEGRLIVRFLPFADKNWNIAPSARSAPADALAKCDCVAVFGVVVCEALEKLLFSERIDAIEAPEYEAPLLYFEEKRATLPLDHPWQKIPTVVHLHSPSHMIFEHDDDPLDTEWVRQRKAFEALSIEMADGVIAPSAFLARQVSEWLSFDEGRVSVIPYPIGPLLSFDRSLAPEEGLCLFVGRVEPRKGVFEFVEAAVKVARKFPKAHFRFVGGPHYRDGNFKGVETAALIKSRLPKDVADRFDFAGKVPRETLGSEYARASFVAVPSRWENYPNTCMEAMSCGRPVLASDQGGMPEMIEDESEGVCVDGKTREALRKNLATGLEKMLSKSLAELLEMGAKSRARILEICDDLKIVKRHLDYYANLAAKTRESVAARHMPEVGAVLFDDGADPKKIARAIGSVNAQTVEAKARIYVGNIGKIDAAARESLASWVVVAQDGADASGLTLVENLAAILKRLPEVIYVGAADDILYPDAMRCAANHFANRPEDGAAACWTTLGRVPVAEFRNDPEHILSPANFAERRFFRRSALDECGGLAVNGCYLPDILIDAAIRLVEKGWRTGCISLPTVETANRNPAAIINPFGFNERRDSIRAVEYSRASRGCRILRIPH